MARNPNVGKFSKSGPTLAQNLGASSLLGSAILYASENLQDPYKVWVVLGLLIAQVLLGAWVHHVDPDGRKY